MASPNDRIRIALIGCGGMGQGDAKYATSIPGVELVAGADIYDGRLTHMKELYGPQTFTTRDYREVLARKDVDAVIVATPDHWHSRISIDALNAGKDVYCEKPMVHTVDQGKPVIEAVRKTGRIFQVGSQYVTSIIYRKAKEVIAAGTIGTVNMVEAWLDRNTALGAWQYSIPPDATPENIDWDRFLGSAPKRPFEPIRLFRWRNYSEYGTAVAGDLFVHLLSGLHFSMNSIGPTRIYATGGLRYWKDGRDAPDVMLALLDYQKTETHPEFTLALRVNFKSGVAQEQFGFRFVGTGGTMVTSPSGVVVNTAEDEREPGYTIGTFSKETQEKFLEEYRQKYPKQPATAANLKSGKEIRFPRPKGFDDHLEHHKVFYDAVRSRKPVVEDAVFGFRAAGPALLANTSYVEKRICGWDPVGMTAS